MWNLKNVKRYWFAFQRSDSWEGLGGPTGFHSDTFWFPQILPRQDEDLVVHYQKYITSITVADVFAMVNVTFNWTLVD